MAEVPSLKKAWTVFEDQEVVVLVIDMTGQTPETAAGYYRDQLGGGDHLYAGEGGAEVLELYQVRELGTTVVIGRDGVVTFRDSETTEPALLQQRIREALG